MYIGAVRRMIAAVTCGTAAFLLDPDSMSLHTRILVSWDVGTIVYLGLAWTLITRADPKMTRDHAIDQDQSSYVIFLLVVTAAYAAMVAIAFLMSPLKGLAFWPKAWHLTVAAVALISSWVLIQTVFAFHYGRRYYGLGHHGTPDSEGLTFPGAHPPSYMDFAYYAFVVGMTSQVSDVSVTSRRMRRITMVHGVVSFVFNVAVLALSVNIIASAIA